MKKEDFLIMLIGLLLLAAMLYTIFFGGDKSMHGVGGFFQNSKYDSAVHAQFG